MTEDDMLVADERAELSGGDVCDREPVTRPVIGLAAIRFALAKAVPESIPATDRRPLESGRRAY